MVYSWSLKRARVTIALLRAGVPAHVENLRMYTPSHVLVCLQVEHGKAQRSGRQVAARAIAVGAT